MADVTRANVSLATAIPGDGHRLPPLLAGEDLTAGDACRVHTDGKVYKTDGTGTGTAGTTAEVHGWVVQGAKTANSEPVTLYHDVDLNYATGLTPGALLYRSATVKGGLQTTAPGTFTDPVAVAVDATRIRAGRSSVSY